MDSTLTLVNPTPIRLDFSKNSMRNSILSVQGLPLYSLSTPDKQQMHTEVRDLHNQELVFVIKQRDFLPDNITFMGRAGGKPVVRNLKSWLKKMEDTDGRNMYILDTEHGVYHWKIDPVHRLVLYSSDDPTHSRPAARMIQGVTPGLWLEAGTEAFRDQILASFLVVETEMRGKEARYKAFLRDSSLRVVPGLPGGLPG